MSSEKWRPFCIGFNVLNPHSRLVLPRGAQFSIESKHNDTTENSSNHIIKFCRFDTSAMF